MKKVLLISGILLTFVIGVYFYYYSDSQKSVLENSKSKQIINSNSLTMMYETEYQSGEYQVSTETTWPQEGYTFNESISKCENGSKLTWDDENKKILLQTNTSDKCYVYFDKEPLTLANYIINNVYVEDGINGLYYHDGQGSYTNSDQEAGDYSYRYSGANPNNYVCFGSDEDACPEDNLYRIIGIFNNQVKLIKNINIGKYSWGNTRRWNETTKPDIYTTLNTTYYGILDETWQRLIDQTHIWQVGGMNHTNYTAATKTVYDYEVGPNQTGYKETMAIGLIYVSDYGYGASAENWILDLTNEYSEIQNSNWLMKSINEWCISYVNAWTPQNLAYAINESGNVDTLSMTFEYEIRPCFYLNSNIKYVSGDGTQQNPYRIA